MADLIKYSSAILCAIALLFMINSFLTQYMRDFNFMRIFKTKSSPRENEIPERRVISKKKRMRIEAIHYTGSVVVLKRILPYMLITRIAIFFITYVFYIRYNDKTGSFLNSFQEIWNRWDSPHYLSIARLWYQNYNDERFFIVFYPLYPMLIKITSIVITDYFAAAVFVSNLFLLVGLFYLYRLVEFELNDSSLALKSVKYTLIFPFSFFFSIAYTESLFFALCVMAFYYMRKKDWVKSGICGMFAALSKNQGILLIIPLLLEIFQDLNTLNYFKSSGKNIKKVTLIKYFFSLILIPFGTFLYLCVNKAVTNDWFKFLFYQKEHWGQKFGFFAQNLKNHYMNIFTMDINLAIGVWIPQISLFFISMVLIIYFTGKLRLSYLAFSFIYLLISYSPTWLLSGPRYVLGAFPIFIMLAMISNKNKWVQIGMDFTMILILLFYSAGFAISLVY